MIRKDRSFVAVVLLAVFGVLATLILLPRLAYAQSEGGHGPAIFDVRRSLPLEPDEPVFHDFYINAGPEAGFRKGQYITVTRPLPIQDPVMNRQQAMLDVTVGYLVVIQVQRGITVARLFGELTDEERPALEYESIMIGDRIDLSSLTTKAPKVKDKSKPKKSFFAVQYAPDGSRMDAVRAAAATAVAAAPLAANVTSSASIAPPTAPATAPPIVPQASPQSASKVDAAVAPKVDAAVAPPAQSPSVDPAPQAAADPSAAIPTTPLEAGDVATTSGPIEKASPAASSPDMVRIPVPASSELAPRPSQQDAT